MLRPQKFLRRPAGARYQLSGIGARPKGRRQPCGRLEGVLVGGA
jgi:hypothetical protein